MNWKVCDKKLLLLLPNWRGTVLTYLRIKRMIEVRDLTVKLYIMCSVRLQDNKK